MKYKKFKENIMKTYKLLLSSALLITLAIPAFASEGKKTKEIKTLVGYNVTETTTYEGPKARLYEKIDANKDGTVTFKEYRNFSNVDNEYAIFSMMDTDRSKTISIEEFVNAQTTKGQTQFESELHGKNIVKGTNLKTRSLPKVKTYYEAVEPEIVEIKDIEPAAE